MPIFSRRRIQQMLDDLIGVAAPAHFIGRLNDKTQECLKLAFVEGRSHDEIARLTTNPLGSVKSWIRRGLLSLKECLSAEGQAT